MGVGAPSNTQFVPLLSHTSGQRNGDSPVNYWELKVFDRLPVFLTCLLDVVEQPPRVTPRDYSLTMALVIRVEVEKSPQTRIILVTGLVGFLDHFSSRHRLPVPSPFHLWYVFPNSARPIPARKFS